jgi:hypothetical protein
LGIGEQIPHTEPDAAWAETRVDGTVPLLAEALKGPWSQAQEPGCLMFGEESVEVERIDCLIRA